MIKVEYKFIPDTVLNCVREDNHRFTFFYFMDDTITTSYGNRVVKDYYEEDESGFYPCEDFYRYSIEHVSMEFGKGDKINFQIDPISYPYYYVDKDDSGGYEIKAMNCYFLEE